MDTQLRGLTCSRVIETPLVDKDLVKDDGSSPVHGDGESGGE